MGPEMFSYWFKWTSIFFWKFSMHERNTCVQTLHLTDNCSTDLVYQAATGFRFFIKDFAYQQLKERAGDYLQGKHHTKRLYISFLFKFKLVNKSSTWSLTFQNANTFIHEFFLKVNASISIIKNRDLLPYFNVW